MTLNSQEHIDIMNQFEKDTAGIFGKNMEREDRELFSRKIFYKNGKANEAFLMYKLGYSFGRCQYLNQ